MGNEFTIKISASAVAWYGAIVASLGFAFSAYQIWRDSSRVKIYLEKHLRLYNAAPLYKEDIDYIGVTVINKGRRPVKITHAALLILGEDGKLLLADSFAEHRVKVLTEKNPKTQFLGEASLVDINKVWCILISDATGKEYRKYILKFPTFLRFYYSIKKLLNKYYQPTKPGDGKNS